MKKIVIIMLKVILITSIIQFSFISTSHASFWGDIFSSGYEFIENGSSKPVIDTDNMRDEVSNLYSALFAVGIIVAVIWGAVLGIKFILGSIDEKAKIKESILIYILGCVIIFGSFGIWRLVINIMSNVT